MEIDQVVDKETLDAMAEDTDQKPMERPQQEEQEKEDVLDTLIPKAAPREWTIGKDEFERKYMQKPLSFVAKMQWFALVGEVLDKAMSGDNALTIGNLFSGPTARGTGALSMEDFRDADTFVQAVGKLVAFSPSFLMQSYCIWLNVPTYERDLVQDLMAQPEAEGGLSDEDGFEIIETFIDQNYEALERFFREKVPQLQKRIQARARPAQEATSPQSKR